MRTRRLDGVRGWPVAYDLQCMNETRTVRGYTLVPGPELDAMSRSMAQYELLQRNVGLLDYATCLREEEYIIELDVRTSRRHVPLVRQRRRSLCHRSVRVRMKWPLHQ